MEVGKSVESAFGKKYLKHKKIFFYLDIISWKAQSRLIKTKRSYTKNKPSRINFDLDEPDSSPSVP